MILGLLVSNLAVADSNIQELATVEVHAEVHHAQHESLKTSQLVQNMNSSLGDLLKDQQGFSNRSMGSAVGRPVFRGLGAARLVVAENGAPVKDMSATAPDHALALSPASSDALVHHQGPSAVLRFAHSTAGVVELVRSQAPLVEPQGEYRSSFDANTMGTAQALNYKFPLKHLEIYSAGLWQWDGNYSTPLARLGSTDQHKWQIQSGAKLYSPWGDVQGQAQVLSQDYGIPGGFVGGHASGVRIQMQRQNAQLEWKKSLSDYSSLSARVLQSSYGHDELELGRTSMQFRLDQRSLDVQWDLHQGADSLVIKGVAEQSDQNFGGFVLSAPNQSQSLGSSMLYQRRGTLAQMSLGLSQEYKSYQMSRANVGKDRQFWSANLSAQLQCNVFTRPVIRFTEMSRIPESDELYNKGPHLAAWSYDQGSVDLPLERGREWELHQDWSLWGIDVSHSVYARDYDAYLMMEPTGKYNTRNGSNLPIWQMRATAAQFAGVEVHLDQEIVPGLHHSLQMEMQMGRESQSLAPLPLMAPPHANYKLEYQKGAYQSQIQWSGAMAQTRLGAFESRTPAYQIWGLGLGRKWHFEHFSLNAHLDVENALDQIWRNHLSRIKDVYPEKGRTFKLSLQALF